MSESMKPETVAKWLIFTRLGNAAFITVDFLLWFAFSLWSSNWVILRAILGASIWTLFAALLLLAINLGLERTKAICAKQAILN